MNEMTDKTMTLEPCPFCGCKDNLGRVYSMTHDEYCVQCFDCDARGPVHADDNDACGAWSSRHLSQPAERGEAVDRVEAHKSYDSIDRWLRNNMDDEEYAEYSAELDRVFSYTTPPPAAGVPDENEASVAAIQFALTAEEGFAWLRLWNEGDFEACRREWPEAPAQCYVGADPLLCATPSPTIDVAAVRDVLQWVDANDPNWSQRNKLARAIGDAK